MINNIKDRTNRNCSKIYWFILIN